MSQRDEIEFWQRESCYYDIPHRRLRLIAQFLGRYITSGSLLDVGCGQLALRQLLKDQLPGLDYWGVDLVAPPGQPQVRSWNAQDPAAFPWPGRRYSALVASGLLEYLDRRREFLTYCLQHLLLPGGLLVVSFYNFHHPTRLVRRCWGGAPLHPYWREPSSLGEFRRMLGELPAELLEESPTTLGLVRRARNIRMESSSDSLRPLQKLLDATWARDMLPHQRVFLLRSKESS